MAYGDQTGSGYQSGTVNAYTAARDLGRTAIGGVTPLVQEITHAITGLVTPAQVNVAVAGTRVQFPANVCLAVVVQARKTNSGDVVVGDGNVVAQAGANIRRGHALSPGEAVALEVSNSSLLWLDAVYGGDGVTWNYLT